MKITVNVQRRNNKGQPIGQDAVPYASDNMVIVADGLGGMGSYVHKELNPDFYNEEKAVGMILSVLKDAKTDGPSVMYARNAFKDIFEEKRDGASAYFASRFAVLSAIYAFEEAKIFDIKDCLYPASDDIAAADAAFAEKFTEFMKNNMSALGGAIGLDATKVDNDLIFMPTTFSMALFKKGNDGEVDILTLNAGDSRTYFWNAEGIRVITKDHENNKVMNNTLNPLSKASYIEARRFVVDSPCVLFSATDGIHDTMYYTKPLYLESVLFGPFAEAYDSKLRQEESAAAEKKKIEKKHFIENDQGNSLTENLQTDNAGTGQFRENGVCCESEKFETAGQDECTEESKDQKLADECAAVIAEEYSGDAGSHDDSNTMAMTMIGYKDFYEFAETAYARVKHIVNLHRDWDKFILLQGTLRRFEGKINRAILTGLLNKYGAEIEKETTEKIGEAQIRRTNKKCRVEDFAFARAGHTKYDSVEDAIDAFLKTNFKEYGNTEIPKGLVSYDELKAKSQKTAVSNYWYKNGARIVCESIAGVGEGKVYKFDMSSILLPKITEEIRTSYAQAYKSYNELKAIHDEYDAVYSSMI